MRLSEREVVARLHRVQLRELRTWVREGWIRPALRQSEPMFDDLDLARIRLLCDLRKDLALPPDALPPILSLLDQLHGLRRELGSLARAVDAQPGHIRDAVYDAYRRSISDPD